MRWASERADYRNVNFRAKDSPAWLPSDFLGRTERGQRLAGNAIDLMAVQSANLRLMSMRQGDPPPDDLPEWARA